MAQTTAYLDQTDAVMTVVNTTGKTLRTFRVPPQVVASEHGRQGAWARSILRHNGFTPEQRTGTYPYGITVPLQA